MDSPDKGADRAEKAGTSAAARAAAEIPDRYSIRRREETRELVCNESPTMAVRIERGKTVPAGAAHKAPPGTIYLDGAAEGGPFLDVEKAVFNLDHHEGCVRSFTLSTCEQAMVIIRKGVDLQRRDWTIHANDPDLDTVFAIWLLLNHMRLNEADPEIRRKVMPLVRLQGVIDAHGLEMQELCGFPPDMEASIFAELERLRSREIALKKEGVWQEIDFLEYTAGILRAIDAMIYSSRHFEGVLEVEELARAEIGDNQLAIVCRGETGIYEVEPHLRRLHGRRLGVIILQKDPKTYTLRQVETFLPATLESAYKRLNLIDPAAGNRRSGNRWGGSGEIGGSPRATGTSLTPQQIADALGQAYRRPTAGQRLAAMVIVLTATSVVMTAPLVANYLWGWFRDAEGLARDYLNIQPGAYAGGLAVLVGVLTLAALRRGRKLYGFSMPVGYEWLALAPTALLAGGAGGAWVANAAFPGLAAAFGANWTDVAVALGFPCVAEVLFRGLVHGMLAQRFPSQYHGGPWFLSWPVAVSGVLYAVWSLLPILPFFSLGPVWTFIAALLFGISLGMARERSESLAPCLILHWACLPVVVVTASYWGG